MPPKFELTRRWGTLTQVDYEIPTPHVNPKELIEGFEKYGCFIVINAGEMFVSTHGGREGTITHEEAIRAIIAKYGKNRRVFISCCHPDKVAETNPDLRENTNILMRRGWDDTRIVVNKQKEGSICAGRIILERSPTWYQILRFFRNQIIAED